MNKKKIAFFDVKPYDRLWFDKLGGEYELVYYEYKLNADTAYLARGCEVACAFVNDDVNAAAIEALYTAGVKLLAMRSAGYSNVDVKAAFGKIHIVRVPAYSPHAVAEHAMAMLQTLNRKLHRAYARTRDFNFSIVGFTGIDLYGKTAGVVGTGKIGRAFIDICRGYGMRVAAYDPYPVSDSGIEYLPLDRLLEISDVISLHCPLTEQSHHLMNAEAFGKMKQGAFVVNTSRGALIDSEALLAALNSGRLRGAALDVYEEEADLFYEDFSGSIIHDDTLALLVSRPNVLLTSHQAFLTEEALKNIAETTIDNIGQFFAGGAMENEVCYQCDRAKVKNGCRAARKERCF